MTIVALLLAMWLADPVVESRLAAIESSASRFRAEQAALAEASDDAERLRRLGRISR